MNCAPAKTIKVFCVDDNHLVAEAVRLQLERADDVHWAGSAADATAMLREARRQCCDVVLLDIDMPGKNPFEAIGELTEICPESRVVMYSGLLKRDLVDRAVEAGAWGYVAKTDGETELLAAIRMVASGSFAFSRSVLSLIGEG